MPEPEFPTPTRPPTPVEVAERIVAAHDRYDRCLANLRNAVALPDDDPRGRDVMVEKATGAYTLALVFLDEIQGFERANVPVGADVDAPPIEPPIARVTPGADEGKAPPIEQPPATDRGAA